MAALGWYSLERATPTICVVSSQANLYEAASREPSGQVMAGEADAALHHQRWTQTDITALRELVRQGASLLDISARLNRQLADVDRMAERLRLVRVHADP